MAWTLSEVVKRTGAQPRSVQIWADAGIVHPVEVTDRSGSGVHRQFELHEVKLIALLVPLANWKVPIGWLRDFAKAFRSDLYSRSKKSSKSSVAKQFERAFDRASLGEGQNYLIFTYSEKKLWFDVVTDEHGPAIIDPVRIESQWIVPVESHMLGVLNMTSALKNLRD